MKNKKFYAAILAGALGLTVMQGFAAGAEVERDLRGTGQIKISAETDFKKDLGYPIIAIRETPLALTIEGMEEKDTVWVNRNGMDRKVEREGENCIYTPQIAGIFEVQVRDEKGKVKEARKIYVRPKDPSHYYQLKDIETTNKPIIDVIDPLGIGMTTGSAYLVYNETTTTSAYTVKENTVWEQDRANWDIEESVKEHFLNEIYPVEKSCRPLTFSSELGTKQESGSPVMGFKVGESDFEQKTILSKEINGNTLQMKEGHDIDLGTGHYRVESFVKNKFSNEMQDHKVVTYKRDNPTFHQLTAVEPLSNVELTVDQADDGYTAKVKAECVQNCELEYAFLLTDYAGTRVIKEYEELGTDNIGEVSIPNFGWDFTVSARVKHKKDIDWRQGGDSKLSNSYEIQLNEDIKGKESLLEIQYVTIEPQLVQHYYDNKGQDHMEPVEHKYRKHAVGLSGQVPEGLDPRDEGTVSVKDKNYISIGMDKMTLPVDHKWEYKAWVVDDGYYTLLKDYSDEGNSFVYYPLSGGSDNNVTLYPNRTHTLVVSVREKDKQGNIVDVDQQTVKLKVE